MGWYLILETEVVQNITMEIELLFYRWYVILNPSMTWWNFKFSCFNYFPEEVNKGEIFINRKWPHYRLKYIIFCPEAFKNVLICYTIKVTICLNEIEKCIHSTHPYVSILFLTYSSNFLFYLVRNSNTSFLIEYMKNYYFCTLRVTKL